MTSSPEQSSVSEAGTARRRQAQGAKHASLQASLIGIDPAVAGWSDEFVFGRVWDGDDLSQREQMLVAITALGAQGHHSQLRNYLHGAVQQGVSEASLRQALRMLLVYGGFPVGIQALAVLTDVLATEARRTPKP